MESELTSSLNQRAKNGDVKDSVNHRTHIDSDVDSSRDAVHHTIGYNVNQAAPGVDVAALQLLVADLIERVEALEA